MKKYLQIIFLFFFLYSSVQAQVYKKKVVHAGDNISASSNYLFPSFSNAVVKLKTGGIINSKINFNMLISQMQFLNPNNDTLVISQPENIELIQIDSTTFFYINGYYQVLASSDSVMLVELRKTNFAPVKIGALGLPNYGGTGIQTYTSVVTNVGEKKLVMNEDVEVTTETAYFITTNYQEFSKANKETFVKKFPDKKAIIEPFIKQNKLSLTKEADLKKLFQLCASK